MNANIEKIGQNEKNVSWKNYSLEKWEVFGLVVPTPKVVKLVGYKWVFIRKCNEKKWNQNKCDS